VGEKVQRLVRGRVRERKRTDIKRGMEMFILEASGIQGREFLSTV